MHTRVVLRRAFVAAALGWAVALPLATWIASRSDGGTPGLAFAASVYGIGSIVCHQLPARSFHLWAIALPVCARCTGIYVAAAVTAAVSVLVAAPTPSDATARVALAAALLPTALTVVVEWTTGRMPANWIRAVAGVPIGAVVVWIVMTAVGPEVN